MPSADERAPLIRASRASSASWTRAVALAATLALVAALAAALARGAGRGSIAPVALGLELVRALHAVHPEELDLDATAGMLADPALLTHIREGASLSELLATRAEELRRFRRQRSAALLYED